MPSLHAHMKLYKDKYVNRARGHLEECKFFFDQNKTMHLYKSRNISYLSLWGNRLSSISFSLTAEKLAGDCIHHSLVNLDIIKASIDLYIFFIDLATLPHDIPILIFFGSLEFLCLQSYCKKMSISIFYFMLARTSKTMLNNVLQQTFLCYSCF